MFTKKAPLLAIGTVAMLALAGCSTGSLSSSGDDAGTSTDSAGTSSEV